MKKQKTNRITPASTRRPSGGLWFAPAPTASVPENAAATASVPGALAAAQPIPAQLTQQTQVLENDAAADIR